MIIICLYIVPLTAINANSGALKRQTVKSSDLKAILKKWVFKRRLKRRISETERKLEGKLFHSRAPATENALF